MKTIKDIICIGCPMGCPVKVELEDNTIVAITGNTCAKGKTYAQKECTNPSRIVTSTVPVENGDCRVISVKTASEIPKEKISECINELRGLRLQKSVKEGDILLKNVAGTGVNIIATKSVQIKAFPVKIDR